jgi:hypothetical protein
MLINKAEIHLAPETPRPSALMTVEGRPKAELRAPIKQAQAKRIRPPARAQKAIPAGDRPSPSMPPTIRAGIQIN